MEEQVCPYCQLAESYMEDILSTKTENELFEVLHALVDDVHDLTKLDVIDTEIELLKQAKEDIIESIYE